MEHLHKLYIQMKFHKLCWFHIRSLFFFFFNFPLSKNTNLKDAVGR